MKFRDINYTIRDRVGLITIDRPEVMNALRSQTWVEFAAVLQKIKQDDQVRCLVITGAGKAFCAGQDLGELTALVGENIDYFKIRKNIEMMQQITLDLVNLPIPIIAAINGYAVGAGAEIAIACDIRYASEKASFEFTEVKIGLFETNGVTWLLPRLIGLGRAKELMITGDRIDAVEAMQIGLVNRVCPSEDLMNEVIATAKKIALNAPVSLRFVKSCLTKSGETSLEQALIAETDAIMTCSYTDDVREGAAAFFEKRKPDFKGL